MPGNTERSYLKIQRVWGSKGEGWNAFVGVFCDKLATVHSHQFHVNIPFAGCNPFEEIYKELHKLAFLQILEDEGVGGISDVSSTIEEPVSVEPIEENIADVVKPKRQTRKKKTA